MLIQASIETADSLGLALPTGTKNYCGDPGVAFAVTELSGFLAKQMGPVPWYGSGDRSLGISKKPSKEQSSFIASGV